MDPSIARPAEVGSGGLRSRALSPWRCFAQRRRLPP